jgi:hypothetical protein
MRHLVEGGACSRSPQHSKWADADIPRDWPRAAFPAFAARGLLYERVRDESDGHE